MKHIPPTRWFLGANSARGFSSLYESYIDPAAGDFLWVIKGGPGCGKSTFMKKLGAAGEKKGLPVEYIYCSGDPDSLDGVYFPTLREGYVDGTAPHVQEAAYPGAASKYLDMGCFLDDAALRPRLAEIADLNRRYKALYAQAYDLLAAGTALLPKNAPGVRTAAALEKTDRKAAGMAARELRRLNKTPRTKHRFLSAVSCAGRVRFDENLTGRVVAADNALGLGHRYLDRIAALAAERGYDAVLCHDPLEPEKLEAVLLPEADLSFVAAERPADLPPDPYRHLRLDALAPEKPSRQRRKDSTLLLERGMETLAGAKALHDELEAVYRPHVDFKGTDALAKEHIARLFGK